MPHSDWRDDVRAAVATWPPLDASQLSLLARAFGAPPGAPPACSTGVSIPPRQAAGTTDSVIREKSAPTIGTAA